MASSVLRLAPGSVFAERFRVLDYVGPNKRGSEYRAESVESGASATLTLVALEGADGRAARSFERRAEGGSRIRSSKVTRTLAFGTLGGDVGWSATEPASGESLEAWMTSGRALDPEAARRLLASLFDAVAAAHEAGVVHGELEPDEVLVSGRDARLELKVRFGFAPPDLGADLGAGTRSWRAPEQARQGYELAPSADVWSLGLLSFFVLSGGDFWRPTGSGRHGELPRGFDAWLARAVCAEPERRFVDAADAWAALEPLLSAPPPSEPAPHRLSVAPSVFLTAVIFGVVTMGVAIYWLLRSMRI